MKTFLHLWQYLAELFLKLEIFQTKVVGNIKASILCSVTFSRKSCHLWDNAEKYGTAREAADDVIWRTRFAFSVTKATHTHSDYVILLFFHGKDAYTTAHPCHVIRMFPVLLILPPRGNQLHRYHFWSAFRRSYVRTSVETTTVLTDILSGAEVRSRSTAPLMLHLRARCGWAVKATPRPL